MTNEDDLSDLSVHYGRGTCPDGPHRGPEGPNEDMDQCPKCWSLSWSLRPEGQTYGEHLPDCSLPPRHESWCKPGGSGHPLAAIVRGYWPETATCECGETVRRDTPTEPWFDPHGGEHPPHPTIAEKARARGIPRRDLDDVLAEHGVPSTGYIDRPTD